MHFQILLNISQFDCDIKKAVNNPGIHVIIGFGTIPKYKNVRLGCKTGTRIFWCGATPDLLAALQGNPGQPTPFFFASVSTLAVLALPLIIALTRTLFLL